MRTMNQRVRSPDETQWNPGVVMVISPDSTAFHPGYIFSGYLEDINHLFRWPADGGLAIFYNDWPLQQAWIFY